MDAQYAAHAAHPVDPSVLDASPTSASSAVHQLLFFSVTSATSVVHSLNN